jgi:hypothetical protein
MVIERMEPEHIPKKLIGAHLGEQDPLDARSYAGRINPSYRGTERIDTLMMMMMMMTTTTTTTMMTIPI